MYPHLPPAAPAPPTLCVELGQVAVLAGAKPAQVTVDDLAGGGLLQWRQRPGGECR